MCVCGIVFPPYFPLSTFQIVLHVLCLNASHVKQCIIVMHPVVEIPFLTIQSENVKIEIKSSILSILPE